MHQEWSASIHVIHRPSIKGLNLISSHNPALCLDTSLGYFLYHSTNYSSVFCPRAGLLLQMQEPRSKSRSSTANSEIKVAVLLVINRCGCFLHPTLSLRSVEILKDLKRFQGPHVKVGRVNLDNWALQNSPQGLNISTIRVFGQMRDLEIAITLCPLLYINHKLLLFKFFKITS